MDKFPDPTEFINTKLRVMIENWFQKANQLLLVEKEKLVNYETGTCIDSLVGRIIERVCFDGDILTFVAWNDEKFSVGVEGDCCSCSWWSDIFGVKNIVGKMVQCIVESPLLSSYNTEDGRCRQEYDSVYGFRIVCVDGSFADFIFRNSSNGYYGGWMKNNKRHVTEEQYVIENDWQSPKEGE